MAEQDIETHESLQSPGASLADEMYGAPKVEEPETQQEPVAEAEQTEELAAEQAEEQAEEQAAEPEPSASGDDSEEVEVTTLEALAEHLETDPDWLRNLKVTEKVNGHEVEVSISDALRTHRQVTAGDEYLADAKVKAKQIMESSSQEKELLSGSAAVLAGLIQEAEATLNGEMKEQDWARLRREDPGEYTARKEELRERHDRLNGLKQRAMSTFNETGAKLNQNDDAARQAELPKLREKFLELVPEWQDQDVAAQESEQISEYLTSHGHTPEEIKVAAFNPKLLAYVRNSMLYEKSKGKVSAAKKKVVKIPKVMKPGKAKEDVKPSASGDDRVSIMYGQS